MVLKYLIKDYPIQTLYFGIANIVANGLVMLRYVFWLMRFHSMGKLGLRANQAISDLARSSSGSLRTLRMTTPTISLCEAGCFNILLCLYCTRFPCSDDFCRDALRASASLAGIGALA